MNNLSTFESANCYIVSEAGKYKFKTVKGNSSTSVGNLSTCEVLWESFGTATTPSMSGSECSCGAGLFGLAFLPVAELGGGDAGFLFELRCEILRVLELEYDGYFLDGS